MTGLELHNAYRSLAKWRRDYLKAIEALNQIAFEARIAAYNLGTAARDLNNASSESRKASKAFLAALDLTAGEGSVYSELVNIENLTSKFKWDFGELEELAAGLGAPKPKRRRR